MKKCTGCERELNIDQFHKDKTGKLGVRSRCKDCEAEYAKNRKEKHQTYKAENCSPTHRFLSLGAGVQSSTLLHMAAEGLLGRVDGAIFADTQWEPDEVYEQLERLQEVGEQAGIPVYIVSAGSLEEACLENDFIPVPFYIRNKEGKSGILRRQCTSNYKITPVRQKLAELIGRTHGQHVDLLIGISWDEAIRMKDSNVKWLHHIHPLIDQKMTREECLSWMESRNLPMPPKSSCIACPFHSNSSWKSMSKENLQKAADFEAKMRERHDLDIYLHPSLRPLPLVDFNATRSANMAGECEGVCGW